MGEPGNNLEASPKALLLKASNKYQNQQLEEAIEIFEKVASSGSDVYKSKANWYLALCYLKQNQPAKAKPLLTELQQNNEYKKEVSEILKQLK